MALRRNVFTLNDLSYSDWRYYYYLSQPSWKAECVYLTPTWSRAPVQLHQCGPERRVECEGIVCYKYRLSSIELKWMSSRVKQSNFETNERAMLLNIEFCWSAFQVLSHSQGRWLNTRRRQLPLKYCSCYVTPITHFVSSGFSGISKFWPYLDILGLFSLADWPDLAIKWRNRETIEALKGILRWHEIVFSSIPLARKE